MRIPRIYLPATLANGQTLDLTEYAFQHSIKVLRLKQGAKLILFDGLGNEFSASIDEINKKSASVIINESISSKTESDLAIHLGIGISKGERMDYAIQKAVELGVEEITPLFTEYCVVNLDEKRAEKRYQHWQGIIVSASEQCGRSVLAKLNRPVKLNQWSENISNSCIVLDPLSDKSLSSITHNDDSVSLLIGPEGGLSKHELENLNNLNNFNAVKFGPRILRTETAAVSAITALQLLWGDLNK